MEAGSENVDRVRRAFDAFNAGTIDRALEVADDDLEMDWSNSIGPLRGIYRGRAEVAAMWTAFLDAWDRVRRDPDEIYEPAEGLVMVVNRVRMRGRGSGVEVDATGIQLWTFDGGRAKRIKLFQSKQAALEAIAAAGIDE